jgi:hypothetical protein
MKLFQRSHLTTMLALTVAAAACGGAVRGADDGATNTSGGNAIGGGAGSNDTGGRSNDADGGWAGISGGLGVAGDAGQGGASTHWERCEPGAPPDGEWCDIPGRECEYYGSGPLGLCSTVARCAVKNGPTATWNVTWPSADCVATQAQDSTSCPATIDAVMNGGACPAGESMGSATCVYDEGICACNTCFDEDGGEPGAQKTVWTCETYMDASNGCPSARPALGTTCGVEGQQCSYGQPCGGPLPFSSEKCTGGFWVDDPSYFGCPVRLCN